MLGLNTDVTYSNLYESNLPLFVSSNLECWLTVYEGITVNFTGGAIDKVTTWEDSSNTNKFIKLATGSEPEINGVYNDLVGVKFTGTTGGDALKLVDAAGSNAEITLDRADGGYTIAFIATNEGFDSGSVLFGSRANNDSFIKFSDGGEIKFMAAGNETTFAFSPALNDEVFHSFMIVQQQGGGIRLYINNVLAASDSNNNDFEFSMLGGNDGAPKNQAPSFIKQIILYNDAISDTDRDALYTNYISPLI
mgnify:CR=1 FL=1|tara:strand:+ start:408 stop:1157 length:750 start_codon:yes stop_codon:yes gene_type:complete